MPRDVEMDVEFRCPRCFGSCFNSNLQQGVYYCKGHDGRSCGFTFPLDDMWCYSAQVTRVTFETKEEYEMACRGEAVC